MKKFNIGQLLMWIWRRRSPLVIFASIVTLVAIAGVICWLLAPPIWQTISQNPEGEIPDSTRIELAKTVAELFLGVLVLEIWPETSILPKPSFS